MTSIDSDNAGTGAGTNGKHSLSRDQDFLREALAAADCAANRRSWQACILPRSNSRRAGGKRCSTS